jgi:hypothetical protein
MLVPIIDDALKARPQPKIQALFSLNQLPGGSPENESSTVTYEPPDNLAELVILPSNLDMLIAGREDLSQCCQIAGLNWGLW